VSKPLARRHQPSCSQVPSEQEDAEAAAGDAVVPGQPLEVTSAAPAPSAPPPPLNESFVREWRCKWSGSKQRASLLAAQRAVEGLMGEVKSAPGYVGTTRFVCPAHKDLKVSVQVRDLAAYEAWKKVGFAPEVRLMEALREIEGITVVEAQSFIANQ